VWEPFCFGFGSSRELASELDYTPEISAFSRSANDPFLETVILPSCVGQDEPVLQQIVRAPHSHKVLTMAPECGTLIKWIYLIYLVSNRKGEEQL
jgi:hypothetical protein